MQTNRRTFGKTALKATLLAPALALISTSRVFGQTPLPPGPIRFIVPYSPGSGSDTIGRTAGLKLGERVDRPTVVDNRPGASGMLGTEAVVRAPANGSTLLITASTIVINRALYPKASFDPLKDLTPIVSAGSTQFLLVASTQSGFKNMADMLKAVRKSPGKVNYGSPGVGTVHHLAMELFKIRTRTSVYHIPYSGAGPAVTGLLGGQVDVMFLPLTFAMPHVKSGKLIALAIGSDKRHPSAPDVPTLTEAGVKDTNVSSWYGIYGPPGMAPDLVAKLNAEFREILATDEMRQKFFAQGIDIDSSTPGELKTLAEKDAARWAAVIKQQNITAE
ncbi:MAG: tripartite tricarboxylate transporter substrate binding protein [Pseudomonadota bacterium]